MAEDSKRTVVICLGYILNSDGSMDDILVKRLEKAAQVHQQEGNIPLYVTGGDTVKCGQSEAKIMGKYLKETLDVNSELIHYDHEARNTLENFIFTSQAIRKQFPGNDLIEIHIVTSSWHFPRSRALARTIFRCQRMQVKFVDASCQVECDARRIDNEKSLVRRKLNKWLAHYKAPQLTTEEIHEVISLLDSVVPKNNPKS